MITMEAPSEEQQIAQDLSVLARIEAGETTLRPLFRRTLERSRAKLQAGRVCSTKEREILHRIASL